MSFAAPARNEVIEEASARTERLAAALAAVISPIQKQTRYRCRAPLVVQLTRSAYSGRHERDLHPRRP